MGATAGVMNEDNHNEHHRGTIMETIGNAKTLGELAVDVYKGVAIEATNAAIEAKNKALTKMKESNIARFGETTPPDPNDLLLSFKALALCKLSYMTSIHPEHKDIEARWIRALEVENYQIWYTTDKSTTGPRSEFGSMISAIEAKAITTLKDITEKELAGALAITGTIPYLASNRMSAIPFVVFRGTTTASDVLENFSSLLPEPFVTKAGNHLGRTGLGFYNHYTSLRDMRKPNNPDGIIQTTLRSMATNPHAGILIAGHGLGAAAATLLAAEVYTDYKNVPITIATFGVPPNVFDEDTYKRLSYKGLQHIRFIDKGDQTIGVANSKTTNVLHFSPVVTSPITPAEQIYDYGDKLLDWHVVATINDKIGFNTTSLVNAVHKFALTFKGSDDISGKDDVYARMFLNSNTFKNALFGMQDILLRESFEALEEIFYAPVHTSINSSTIPADISFGVTTSSIAKEKTIVHSLPQQQQQSSSASRDKAGPDDDNNSNNNGNNSAALLGILNKELGK